MCLLLENPLVLLPVGRGALLTGEGEKRTACAHCGTGRFCRIVRKGPAVNCYINRTQVTFPSPKKLECPERECSFATCIWDAGYEMFERP